MKLTDNTILLIGATSGIGLALAVSFHRLGNRVIVAGRRQERLQEIVRRHSDMTAIAVDVDDGDSIRRLAVSVRERFPDLNVLVNNAGISRQEDLRFGTEGLSVAQSIIKTNILGVLQITAEFLPRLAAQPSSTIITTTSGLAFVPRAAYPTYCASKAFLHSWLQSLRVQLRDTPIEVLELAPPYVQTELAGPAQANDPAAVPLDSYVREVMALLGDPATVDEILVERVRALREAERHGQYDAVFASLNG